MVYEIDMLHPNVNANQVWRFRGPKRTIRAQAHERMARLGVFFTTGDIRRAA